MCPVARPDPICPICGQSVALGVPVVFNHGDSLHLDCYVGTEGAAALVANFLETRPSERFCHVCLAQHLARERQEVEKAVTALRLTRRAVVEPGFCSTCTLARVTVRARSGANGIGDRAENVP
jgi:hypothetical protein